MPELDPELAAATADWPAAERLVDVAESRALGAARLGPLVRDPSRVAVEDRSVSGSEGAGDLRLRIYRPTGATRPLPGLLWIHGGGFAMGNLDTEDDRCQLSCSTAELIVVSVDYRLAPEHPFPAGFDDCVHTLRWTADHAAELGIDPARLGVAGSSAGGGLAAATALHAHDQGAPPLVFQMLRIPVLDDRLTTTSSRTCVDSRFWSRGDCERMWDHYLGTTRATVSSYAAPTRATDLRGLPPTYILAAQCDPLGDEAIAYAQALLDAGVRTELYVAPGGFHGFDGLVPDAAVSRRATASWTAALRDGMHG